MHHCLQQWIIAESFLVVRSLGNTTMTVNLIGLEFSFLIFLSLNCNIVVIDVKVKFTYSKG